MHQSEFVWIDAKRLKNQKEAQMPTRRQFLAASVVPLLPTLGNAGPAKRRSIPFAFSLYGMRSLKLDDALAQCAKIGYDGVELALMPDWPADPARLGKDDRTRLRRRLTDLNLALVALMENLPPSADAKVNRMQLDRLRAAAELGQTLSPDAHPIVETILGGPVGGWEKVRRLFADRVGEWANIGEKTRAVITVKPHRSNAMNRPEHALWLLDQVKSPWIKLAYDYSHFQFRELTLADTLRQLLPHTRFVHVKDVRIEKGRMQFLLPGAGTIDYVDLLTRLREGKYAGAVCVEVSGQVSGVKGYDPVVAARRCYDNLLPAFRKARLR